MSLFGVMRHSTPEENAAYRRMIASMSEKLVPEREVIALKAENTKLRELVSGLEWCACHSGCNESDESCPLYKSDAVGDKRYGCKSLESELGVKV